MERLTEYHHGVAVIKGKRFKEAAERLAMYEDMFEQSKIEINEQIKKRIEKCCMNT